VILTFYLYYVINYKQVRRTFPFWVGMLGVFWSCFFWLGLNGETMFLHGIGVLIALAGLIAAMLPCHVRFLDGEEHASGTHAGSSGEE
jgi:hypothetical protein